MRKNDGDGDGDGDGDDDDDDDDNDTMLMIVMVIVMKARPGLFEEKGDASSDQADDEDEDCEGDRPQQQKPRQCSQHEAQQSGYKEKRLGSTNLENKMKTIYLEENIQRTEIENMVQFEARTERHGEQKPSSALTTSGRDCRVSLILC